MASGVHVDGLRELDRALRAYDRDIARTTRDGLKEAAEPVRTGAEEEAVSGISNIGNRWSRMRTGALTSGVYIAPKARRRGGPGRANLAPLLFREMTKAAVKNRPKVIAKLDKVFDRLASRHGL